MLAKVGEAADLLLVAKDTGSHTFASHIEGQLKQPADPTGVETTFCPVTFYSISGAFEEGGIAKITVPHVEQRVTVAGTEGAVMANNGCGSGKVSIGGGRLWLGGVGEGQPGGDLRSCHQFVRRGDLPDDKAYVPDGWQWLSAVADIVPSQSP
ncbi:unnamed protein product [Vitrella brassicaformis CCMP3155]|uniref:Uncharacterized protein n=1 Tax=Vitrella brassicaformis (strain CCMP3155) TaxID=1169540 RepID=A0A0G4EVH1_VITBC|nr:unnamed protein product [Vitrella brassicaformis CCMP3155]|eukprot:CEM02271.1 unnamed protein product [Vitrella brassicaformis CCMP3155]